MTGTCVTKNTDRGFLFIKSDDGRTQYFCHVTAFRHKPDFREIEVGDRLSFEAGEGAKGPCALGVEPA